MRAVESSRRVAAAPGDREQGRAVRRAAPPVAERLSRRVVAPLLPADERTGEWATQLTKKQRLRREVLRAREEERAPHHLGAIEYAAKKST